MESNCKLYMVSTSLGLRMYFFVPYNISPIQQAIQAGHAAQQYDHLYKDDPQLIDFIENHKTWIILNGGTTNDDENNYGTMNQLAADLYLNKIKFVKFREPDLNNALTAICFIAEEKVWNTKDYPDFPDFLMKQEFEEKPYTVFQVINMDRDSQRETYGAHYINWQEDIMGGEQNVFLRDLLKGKKLA
jgi:hypothetical protein